MIFIFTSVIILHLAVLVMVVLLLLTWCLLLIATVFSLAGMRFTARSVSSWWKTRAWGAERKAGSFSPSVWASSLRPTSLWRSVLQGNSSLSIYTQCRLLFKREKNQFWQNHCTFSKLFLFRKAALVRMIHCKSIIYLHTLFMSGSIWKLLCKKAPMVMETIALSVYGAWWPMERGRKCLVG